MLYSRPSLTLNRKNGKVKAGKVKEGGLYNTNLVVTTINLIVFTSIISFDKIYCTDSKLLY